MKRFIPLLASVLLLVSCRPAGSGFRVTVDARAGVLTGDVIDAAARVIQRRAGQLGEKEVKPVVRKTRSGADIFVAFKELKNFPLLAQQLAEPINFRIMLEAPAAQATVTIPQIGSFKETGITERNVEWISVFPSQDKKTALATIRFDATGKAKLEQIFAANQGKTAAIFARGRMVTRKLIGPTDTNGIITIEGIPDVAVATVFADDINVGAHAAFTPILPTPPAAPSPSSVSPASSSAVSRAK